MDETTYLRVSEQFRSGCVFCAPDPALVVRTTASFGVCFDVAPLAPGHLIIHSAEHHGSAGELPPELFDELATVRTEAAALLRARYGRVMFYEHGRAGHCLSDGPEHRLCHHFHLHCVPVDVDLGAELDARFERVEMHDYAEITALYDRYGDYLYVEDDAGRMTFYVVTTEIERHLLRTLVATRLGVPERADWRSYRSPAPLASGMAALAALAAAPATAAGAPAADGRRPPDVSLAVVCFGDSLKTGAMSVAEFLDAAVAHGLSAVELCDRTVRSPDRVAAELRARDLVMPSVALRNDFTVPAADLPGQVAHIREWLPVVRDLGATVARVWTGWQATDARARRQVVAAFDELVDDAAAAGVVLAVETHGGLSNDPAFVADLCARYPRGRVGVCLDFGNLPEPRRELIAAFVPLTVHVHVKTYAFDEAGEETEVPVVWAVRELARAGYSGQWVCEYEGDPPYGTGIRHTLAALDTGRDAAARTDGAAR